MSNSDSNIQLYQQQQQHQHHFWIIERSYHHHHHYHHSSKPGLQESDGGIREICCFLCWLWCGAVAYISFQLLLSATMLKMQQQLNEKIWWSARAHHTRNPSSPSRNDLRVHFSRHVNDAVTAYKFSGWHRVHFDYLIEWICWSKYTFASLRFSYTAIFSPRFFLAVLWFCINRIYQINLNGLKIIIVITLGRCTHVLTYMRRDRERKKLSHGIYIYLKFITSWHILQWLAVENGKWKKNEWSSALWWLRAAEKVIEMNLR